MTNAANVLRSKADRSIHTIRPEASVFDAVKLMAEKNIGALLVVTETGQIVGMITERDYARKIVLLARSSRETQVRDAMTSPVLFVGRDRTSEECMALMTDKRIRHLPVFEGDKLIGVLSIGDLVKETISQQEFIIKQLETYIMS